MDCLTELYLVKKYILMLENLKNGLDFTNELFEDFQKRHIDATDELTLLSQICEMRDILKASIPSKQLEEWEYSDYEIYTDKHYHRLFWNEIDNDKIVEYFFDKFREIVGVDNTDTSEFCVSLYDFHDEDVFFETEADMEDFLEKYDCAPYTAFQVEGNCLTELYSA